MEKQLFAGFEYWTIIIQMWRNVPKPNTFVVFPCVFLWGKIG